MNSEEKKSQPRVFVFLWSSRPRKLRFVNGPNPRNAVVWNNAPSTTDDFSFTAIVRGPGTKNSGQLGLYGGRIDEGESAVSAAARELHEEGRMVFPHDLLKLVTSTTYKQRRVTWLSLDVFRVPNFEISFTDEVSSVCLLSTKTLKECPELYEDNLHYSLLQFPGLQPKTSHSPTTQLKVSTS